METRPLPFPFDRTEYTPSQRLGSSEEQDVPMKQEPINDDPLPSA